jgi:hypothetical protein
MTKEEALLFKQRWRLVNDRVIEEVRQTPITVKLRQLAIMFAAGHALGWADKQRAGEEEVRARWVRLKEKLHV